MIFCENCGKELSEMKEYLVLSAKSRLSVYNPRVDAHSGVFYVPHGSDDIDAQVTLCFNWDCIKEYTERCREKAYNSWINKEANRFREQGRYTTPNNPNINDGVLASKLSAILLDRRRPNQPAQPVPVPDPYIPEQSEAIQDGEMVLQVPELETKMTHRRKKWGETPAEQAIIAKIKELGVNECMRRTGITWITIANIRDGKSRPATKTAEKIKKLLNE